MAHRQAQYCVAAALSRTAAGQRKAPQPYMLGNPLGLPINPAPNGTFNPISPNVKVFGAIYRPRAVRTIRVAA